MRFDKLPRDLELLWFGWCLLCGTICGAGAVGLLLGALVGVAKGFLRAASHYI